MARILLIEDDGLLRQVIATALAGEGHTVRQAEDGVEGLACFRAGHFDLVITDLIMPRKEGIETIAELRQANPHLPILAISGAAQNSGLYLTLARQLGARRTLQKPFDFITLTRTVADLLAEAGGSPARC
ncbi:MAG: response regulator [Opitutae bacterium]|nr:response regulator [Opitutae bacterium]